MTPGDETAGASTGRYRLNPPPADSSARFTLSKNVSYSLIVGAVFAVFSAGVYFTTQTLTNSAAFAAQGVVNASVAKDQARTEADSKAQALQISNAAGILDRLAHDNVLLVSRLDGMDKREDQRVTNMTEIRDRLVGLEALSRNIAANVSKHP